MRYILCFIHLLVCTGVCAQDLVLDDKSVDYDADRLYAEQIDIQLFNSSVNLDAGMFGVLFDRNFAFIVNPRRGYNSSFNRNYLDNISLNDALTRRPIWGLVSAARTVEYIDNADGYAVDQRSAVLPFAYGNSYASEPGSVPENMRAWLRYGTIMYGIGGGYSSAGRLGKKWLGGAHLRFRGGRDGNISSLEGSDYLAQITLQRQFDGGSRFTLSAMVDVDNRTQRLPITKLAAQLSADNLYNPSWGWLGGERINSKRGRQNNALVSAKYSGRLSESTQIDAVLAVGARGVRNSALAWFDAMDSRPDYYRYMPGFIGADYADQVAEAEWINSSQIDWTELYGANLSTGGSARYIIEDRCEDIVDGQLALALNSSLGRNLELNYGVAARVQSGEYYKKINNLLGAEKVDDIDSYLIDNMLYGDRLHNNTRDRTPKVQGDKFGYNYAMVVRDIKAYADLCYRYKSLTARANVLCSSIDYQRNGRYEKELFAGDLSYGKSPQVSFSTMSLMGELIYKPLTHHRVALKFMYSNEAPSGVDVFVSPRYRNSVIERRDNIDVSGLELHYLFTGKVASFGATAYYTRFSNMSDVTSYYDDLEAEFCNMIMYDISQRHYGVELSGVVRFNTAWNLKCIATLGEHSYSDNPTADIRQDNNDRRVVSDYEVDLKGYKVGNVAATALSAHLNYNHNLWMASLSLNVASGRYVEPTANRRMRRVYSQFTDDSQFREAVAQEQLPTALTVNLFVQRSVKTKRGNYYTFFASINNALARKDNVYVAYEQMRVRKQSVGVNTLYMPMPTTYLYSNRRSFHCGISYKFF